MGVEAWVHSITELLKGFQRKIDIPIQYLDFFENIGVGVDLFVYTIKEVKKIISH